MAANGTSFVKAQRNLLGFAAILTAAACEWFLIFLLLIDAVLSYLLVKFASYCDLQTPCLLCSRLDHVLGNEKPELYRSLLCSNHRSEISSLIACHIHGKLADGRRMCDDCLLSFTTKNKSNPEMQRFLVGKMGLDRGGCGFQSQLLNRDFISGPSSLRLCSCCGRPWRSRQNSQRLLQLQSSESGATKPNIPLPRAPNRRLYRRDSLKKIRDKLSGSVSYHHLGNNGFDPMSHVGYTELKITSDSESEFPFSDDDDDHGQIRDKREIKEDSAFYYAPESKPKTLNDGLASAKVTHQSSYPRPPLIDPCIRPDLREPRDAKCLTYDDAIGHDLGELNWQQNYQKSYPSALHDQLISPDDIPPSSDTTEVPSVVSSETYNLKYPLSQKSNSPASPDLISLVDTSSSFNAGEVPVGVLPGKCISRTSGVGHISINEHEDILESATGADFETDQVVHDPAPVNLEYVDPINVYKSAVSCKEREASNFDVEQPTAREPDRVSEELKLLQSQNSYDQEIDLSMNNASPRVHGPDDILEITAASSSNGIQMLPKSILMETTESGLESLDGSTVSEIEGESVADRLKRQVEYDRKCLSSLYKELEEERNASAVAANQAMAMITRLQEEKAALHMEALQYLRMMEEQAEFDVEALEKANDLLAEKEKEMQDMEAELEFYRLNFPDESMVENIHEGSNLKEENVTVGNMSAPSIKNDANVSSTSAFTAVYEGNDKPSAVKTLMLEFEDEKLYISQCLKSLKRKLCQFSDNGASSDMSDGECSEKVADVQNQEEIVNNEGAGLDGQMKENSQSMQKCLLASDRSTVAQEESIASVGDDPLDCNGRKSSLYLREVDLVALENEISDLNDRLEALEANRDFLEHSLNSLRNGKEGLQFIQEIAHQLQQLQKIGIRLRCHSVP